MVPAVQFPLQSEVERPVKLPNVPCGHGVGIDEPAIQYEL